jgi:hypothetical protein
MRVAVLQSNYIPWKGYFDLVHDVDVFVFYDDVQYTAHDWRNRNRIKTREGLRWLTIPVGARQDRLVCEVALPGKSWVRQHWQRLEQHYGAAPHFERYRDYLCHLYDRPWRTLSELNQAFVRSIATDLLGIHTTFTDSRAYGSRGRKAERLLELLARVGATTYLSGPAGRGYIDPARFVDAGIQLEWKDYAGYPEYPQSHPPFSHNVTILDLLFHTGPDAPYFVWGWRQPPGDPPG